MSSGPRLVSARLVLRRWRHEDREPFAALNADPDVMEYFPSLLGRAESDALIERFEAELAKDGFGLWALEITDRGPFIGFVGLSVPTFEAHFTPAVEVGWRLAREHWGNGYATEAAHEAVRFGFEAVGLPEIVSFTSPLNLRSRAVMKRLGMTHDPQDNFEHPRLPEGHPLRRHCSTD